MKLIYKLSIVIVVWSGLAGCNPQPALQNQVVDYVDPMIGTDFFGHTHPGSTLPFGLVQLGPDTGIDGWTYSVGYAYKDNSIMGFSHTHLSGPGNTICGDILMMPTTGDELQVVPGSAKNPDEGYRSRFSHADEIARPGYYSVLLKDYNIRAELTTTKRAGMHRYTYPENKKSTVIFDLGHAIGGSLDTDFSTITIVNDSLITGIKDSKGVKVYFAAEFNKPFHYYGTFDAGYYTPESGASLFPYKNEEKGEKIGAFVNYDTKQGDQVIIRVGLSYTSVDAAHKNLKAEIDHWNFDQVVEDAKTVWNKAISKVTVEDASEEKKQIFYTAMYHALLAQQIAQDVDGSYFGMDKKIHSMEKGDFYANFSVWDTYRTEHPLLTIIAPDHVSDIIRSIVAKTKEYGWLVAQHFRNEPAESMVGDHLIPVIVDAYLKGHRDYDVEFIYEAMKTKALSLPPAPIPHFAGRSGLTDYMKLGYAPYDKVTEAVPNTMELAYDDWCIAQMALAMGKEDDYELFMKRAGNYANLWDDETQFFRPKKADGSWLPKLEDNKQEIVKNGAHSYYRYFDPLLVGRRPSRHYTESNAWQYLWSVQHDPRGLINLLGGNDKFTDRLDEFFNMSPTISPPKYVGVVGTIGQYVHGNQPSHHVAYLYNYAQKPWLTQEKTRQVMEQLYRTGPGGICGNEDMGSLSSWYILSAMGIYPVTPGHTQYAIGSPLLNDVTISLLGEKTFRIIAENNSQKNIYIQSATLNGEELNRSWIDHSEIMGGGNLHFIMGPEPNKNWANAPGATPYSMTN